MRLALGAVLLINPLISHANGISNNDSSVHNISSPTTEVVKPNLHADWQTLLSQYIKPINNGHSTAVDYTGIKKQQALLQSYLKRLSKVSQKEFDAWSNSKQLAFLINAYNAWTIEFILTEYPNIESIKDLGSFFNSPWDKAFIPLLGKKVSLNDIEHGLIRGSDRYNDPRIHFAVNCASIGCPALSEEAYTENKLETQLTVQTERFLTDSSRNYIKGNKLYLSSIFKWYGDDFEKGFRNTNSIQTFILLYADALKLSDAQKLALSKQDFTIKFLDYNWKLNATN
ncbi:DUF547 domain-containing protein [Psychromonas sp. RZ22]|nr:DUF547 domain-containing protein [Psychromonas sp. RZ22]